ncbi:ATP-binding protein [Mucilaginibacter sp.]|uniref:sensor histidine kinase n=1 Tax=Mucilaginibacter sp. TaxID=1882438 RepID=UPI0025D596FE|nr:ATP-binding protein [Mucilaginibacter sp.]
MHLFSPFFRAGNTGSIQGTGLGLNIVARYASLMDGAIGFESQSGQGSTFTLRFRQPQIK